MPSGHMVTSSLLFAGKPCWTAQELKGFFTAAPRDSLVLSPVCSLLLTMSPSSVDLKSEFIENFRLTSHCYSKKGPSLAIVI